MYILIYIYELNDRTNLILNGGHEKYVVFQQNLASRIHEL